MLHHFFPLVRGWNMLPTQGLQRCLGRAVVVREGAISLIGWVDFFHKAYSKIPGAQNIHFKMVLSVGWLQIITWNWVKTASLGFRIGCSHFRTPEYDFFESKKSRVVNQPKRCNNTQRGWNVLPFFFLKQGVYGRIIAYVLNLYSRSRISRDFDFRYFILAIFRCLFCWVKGHKLHHIPGQWHPHWSENIVSWHFFCVFFSFFPGFSLKVPEYFRHFVQPNVLFWPGHMESHWECLVAKGRAGAWESSQS